MTSVKINSTSRKNKNIELIYPLSPLQQGILFHSLYAPESGVYFNQKILNLKGNIAALKSAWQKIVDRHSVLRTFFVWKNRPTPLQIVLKQVDLPWNNFDWRELSPKEQQQQLSELLLKQRKQSFQLNQAPLIGCSLIQLGEDTYKFILNYHHIILDGWSSAIIVKEVASLYKDDERGETCYLPTPPPFRDYIAWLNSQDKEAALKFWRQTLQGFKTPTPLLGDKFQYQNQQQGSYHYKELELRLSAQVNRKLQDIGQKHHVTLSTIVQAAWALLLSRYSGEKDVVFGVTVSSRPGSLSGVENIVGLFANTLPLRLQISPQQQLTHWLEEIQQLMLQLQDYSYAPLAEIQANSELSGRRLLFESIVVFENYPVDYSALDEASSLQLSEMEIFERNNYPLTVVAMSGYELLVKIVYDAVRFDSDTIARMIGHLETLLEAIVANPQQKLSDLPLLTEPEREQLLVEWNNTEIDYPQDKCIYQLFEAQVEKTPDATAVVFEEETLTYRELNTRANQLAHYLQQLGVKPEVKVGICLERSLEMVIGLLAILKAGGAYVPFDPNYPQERTAFILEQTQAPVLLTQTSLVESIPPHPGQVVCLDADGQTIAQQSQENLPDLVTAEHLAYMIYTSGSTGQPKGVPIPHGALSNFLCSMRQTPGLSSADTLLAVTTYSFDIAALELFLPIIVGARLVVASQEIVADGMELSAKLVDSQATVMQATPATWQLLVASGWNGNNQLKVLCGGEALAPQLASQLRERCDSLWNMYGPTETTIWSAASRVETFKNSVPISVPIANTQLYILDQDHQLVPVGVAGELCIGGAGLSRGYFHRPDLTAEKFIPNPFSKEAARLYKTGDLARYRANGEIEYIGRIDNQVKVRGFRIELGEIEAAINCYSAVREAVVVVREDSINTPRVIAYVVVHPEQTLVTSKLRSFLKSKLPSYMIPAAFISLEALPLTPNGKIDHKALPAPETLRPELEAAFIAPQTAGEKQLAAIWLEVLNLEKIGIHDDFFELGGHSLLITQLLAKVRTTFDVELSLKDLFNAPTIAELAEKLEDEKTGRRGDQETVIDLNAEVVLDSEIVLGDYNFSLATTPQSILLTGATGFLGTFLLHELLQQTSADIYCLIRAENEILAQERIENKLKSYLLWDDNVRKRIIPIVGDLSQPLLGLSRDRFNAIAKSVDVIYHNGAWVNFTYPYSQLKAANVSGTQEVLRLAVQSKLKPVHFISTLSVVNAVDRQLAVIREDTPIDRCEQIGSGYAQSKWVAEKIVALARDRGIPISIYRPGRISGHSQTGVCNPDDHTFRMIRGCIQLGSVPFDDSLVDLIPVDYAVGAIVHLSSQPESLGKTFHLLNPQPTPWNEVANSIISLGYPVKQIDYQQWREQLLTAARTDPDNPLFPLITTFAKKETVNSNTEEEINQQLEANNTYSELTGTSIVCPQIDKQIISIYLTSMVNEGLLDAPELSNSKMISNAQDF